MNLVHKYTLPSNSYKVVACPPLFIWRDMQQSFCPLPVLLQTQLKSVSQLYQFLEGGVVEIDLTEHCNSLGHFPRYDISWYFLWINLLGLDLQKIISQHKIYANSELPVKILKYWCTSVLGWVFIWVKSPVFESLIW